MNYRIYQIQFIDKVFWFDSMQEFPAEGMADRIYADKSENALYRWKGGAYVLFSDSNGYVSALPLTLSGNPSENAAILAYFTVTGSGTSSDRYVFKPKTGIGLSRTHIVITVNAEPSASYYCDIQSNGTQRCMLTIVRGSTAFATHHYYLNMLNIYGKKRWRVNYQGSLVQTDFSTTGVSWSVTADVNSPDVYSSAQS